MVAPFFLGLFGGLIIGIVFTEFDPPKHNVEIKIEIKDETHSNSSTDSDATRWLKSWNC